MKADTVSGRPACWAQSSASRRVTGAFAGGPVVRVSWAEEARGSRAREGRVAGRPRRVSPVPAWLPGCSESSSRKEQVSASVYGWKTSHQFFSKTSHNMGASCVPGVVPALETDCSREQKTKPGLHSC